MHKIIFVALVLCVAVQAGPLNLFVNVTMDDRPDLIIVEGDIAIDTNPTSNGDGRNAYYAASKWTSGILPYVIEASQFTASQKTSITNAMRTIESLTNNCLRFVERTSQATWLRIFSGSGCWSYMGRTKTSGSQDVSLSTSGCIYTSTIIHELLHAAGFAHEQTRPDRDSYVTINWGNIQAGQEGNFQAYTTSQVNTMGYAYDYYSVMHYEWNAFSKNGYATIQPKSTAINLYNLGNAATMTATDIKKVKTYYGCA